MAAAEQVHICYNYDCADEQNVTFSRHDLNRLKRVFLKVQDAQSEREAIRVTMGKMYLIAGKQSPISNDKARNDNEDEVNGRMDCIDHSHNTTAFLKLIEKMNWLTFHHVLAPVKRAPYLVNDHWSARIVETETGEQYVVDTWFLDHGKPATIFPLQDWLKGAAPRGG